MQDAERQIPISIRKEVRIRDNNKCRKCGNRKKLQFHHIIPFLEIGKYSKFRKIVHKKDNLILLCSECHDDSPNSPIDFLKWLRKGKDLPGSFSKCIDLMEMGIPMLILQRRSLLDKGYNLDKDSSDWKELIQDFRNYLVELWELQLSFRIEDNEKKGKILGDFITKQLSKIDINKSK